MLTPRQRQVVSWSGFVYFLASLHAAAILQGERRQDAARERERELAAAAQAGAIAATIVNAVVADDLEAFDASDVLLACPDPSRHPETQERWTPA